MGSKQERGWVAIHDESAGEYQIRTADTSGGLVATVWCGQEPDAEAAERASLIAAAPELLEMLQEIAHDDSLDVQKKAFALIARIIGEAAQ